MKQIITGLLATLLCMIFVTKINAATPVFPISKTTEASSTSKDANAILIRINEIKDMDKANLSLMEKKQLRKELRLAKKQLKAISGGVYISAGSLLIIALILILLL
jgi:uncharacterized protein YggU (UPF0235/DUF167 family)